MKLPILEATSHYFKVVILTYIYGIKENIALYLLGNKIDYIEEYDNINFCNNETLQIIFDKCKIIKIVYPFICDNDIYIIVLYIYYVLNLMEEFFFPFHIIKDSVDNPKEVIEIINDLTMFDVIYENHNISSNIRQAFLLGNNIQI